MLLSLDSSGQCLGSAVLFVPKLPSYRIMDVAKAIGPNCEHRIMGIRPGEKIHEEMITVSDSYNTVDFGPYFAILPQSQVNSIESYCEACNLRRAPVGVSYSSDTNDRFLTVDELRALIARHVEPDPWQQELGGGRR
jgi:FlaA1/EpsC-like NDP-sugar epimerase